MENSTVRELLCEGWIDLSDAYALRCVSTGWRETLSKDDDAIWEKIIDATHGPEIANSLRQSLRPRNGYALARYISPENEGDSRTSTLAGDDLTGLFEFTWQENVCSNHNPSQGREILLTSMFDTWRSLVGNPEYDDENPREPHSTARIPNPFWPGTGDVDSKDCFKTLDIALSNIGCGATFFRRDTQQRLCLQLELVPIHPKLSETIYRRRVVFQGCLRGRERHFVVFELQTWWELVDWEKQVKEERTLKINLYDFMLAFVNFESDDFDWNSFLRGETMSLDEEMLAALDEMSWK